MSIVNPKAAKATLAYVEEQLTPVKEEIKKEVAPIAFVIVFLIFIVILLPLIAYIIWIGRELSVSSWYIACMLLLVIVLSVVAIAIAVYYVASFLEDTIENSLAELEKYSDATTVSNLLSTVNTAVRLYLNAIGQSC